MKNYFNVRKKLHRKVPGEKGFSILAITMIFSVALSLLVGIAVFSGLNTSFVNTISYQGDQATNLALAGIDRSLAMLHIQYKNSLNMTSLNYNNAGLKFDGTNYKLVNNNNPEEFSYPINTPLGKYKVKVLQSTSEPNPVDGSLNGRLLTIEAIGMVGDISKRVVKQVHIYEGINNLFSRALMGNSVPGCMFCHFTVYGKIGSMADGSDFKIWSQKGHDSRVEGNFDLGGNFLDFDPVAPSDASHDQLIFNPGQLNEQYRGTSNQNSNPLPRQMDAMSRNRNYILTMCTGTIEADTRYQIMPSSLYNNYPRSSYATYGDAQNARATNNPLPYKSGTTGSKITGSTGSYSYNTALTLYGTDTSPIHIDGKVYINGDVIIKGTVTGNGVIYSSRNIYIVDDVKYNNPPDDWKHPSAGRADGKPVDQLGLAAEGNIIVGDPFSKYQQPSDHGYEAYVKAQFCNAPGSSDSGARGAFRNTGGDSSIFYNNRYAWDGKNNGETRTVTRIDRDAPHTDYSHTVKTTGLLPEGTNLSTYNLDEYLPADVGGQKTTDLKKKDSAGWLSIQDFNDFTGYMTVNSGTNPRLGRNYYDTSGNVVANTNPQVVSGTFTEVPGQIDALLYSEGCLAGGNFQYGNMVKFHGTMVSNDTNLLSVYAVPNSTSLYYDDRASASFMGFPPALISEVRDYKVYRSSISEFNSY